MLAVDRLSVLDYDIDMINLLQGLVERQTEKFIVINVAGVGYKVFCPRQMLDRVAKIGQEVKIWTHLCPKENVWELYGFLSYNDLEFFELLITISGIGPKTALNILSVVSVDDLEEAIVLGNENVLARASGISKKTAQKIILELKSKVKKIAKSPSEHSRVVDDIEAIDALVSLGYRLAEGRRALDAVPDNIAGLENRVKEALKRLSKK